MGEGDQRRRHTAAVNGIATLVGIDVGGPAKGFHAVALRAERIVDRLQSTAPVDVRDWCLAHRAAAIGIDAPCRFRESPGSRAAERHLAAEKISAFATPSREVAQRNAFYRWMMNGAALYEALEPLFPLYEGGSISRAVCFETFPQAVACALAGRVLMARNKCADRRWLLERADVDTRELTNIDYIDAALCALAARHVHAGTFKGYGERASGFIFVPKVTASGRYSTP